MVRQSSQTYWISVGDLSRLGLESDVPRNWGSRHLSLFCAAMFMLHLCCAAGCPLHVGEDAAWSGKSKRGIVRDRVPRWEACMLETQGKQTMGSGLSTIKISMQFLRHGRCDRAVRAAPQSSGIGDLMPNMGIFVTQ